MQATIKNFSEDGIPGYGNPSELADHFSQALTVEGSADRVEFIYQTADREHADQVLSALGKAVIAQQMDADRAAGLSQNTAVITEPAVRRASPVRDDTNLYMAAIFLGLIALGLILAIISRLFLSRSKRVMFPGAGGDSMAVLAQPIES